MAKIAVIFVLFALCSVAMSARPRRDESNAFESVIASIQTLGKNTEAFFQSPETQKQLAEIQAETKDLVKLGTDQFKKSAEEVQAKLNQLVKDNQGNVKELLDNVSKAFDNAVKTKNN